MITDAMVEAGCWAAWPTTWECLVDHLRAEKRALVRKMLEAAEQAAWRPIEEAPRSDDVILYFPGTEKPQPIGQSSMVKVGVARDFPFRRPTHYRPPPEPPKEQMTMSTEPRWIVNDMGELGVEIGGRCFFCYKGDSIEYADGVHDDGTQILFRGIGKREFGETVWPMSWINEGRSERRYTQELVYIPGISDGDPDDPAYKWAPLPKANPSD